MHGLISKAESFAAHKHKDHVRNDDLKTPYVEHLREVAQLVREGGGSEEEIAAAWLHDVVEDTDATLAEVRTEFGEDVAKIVEGMTDLEEWVALPLAQRKAHQAARIAHESIAVKRVKLADQTSNVQIVGNGRLTYTMDENFAYIAGARDIAEACKGVSDYLDRLFAERYAVAHANLLRLRDTGKI